MNVKVKIKKSSVMFFVFIIYINYVKVVQGMEQIKLGVLFPKKDDVDTFLYSKAANMSLEDYKPKKMNVSLIMEGTDGCDPLTSAGKASDLIYLHNITALIGPSCAQGCLAALTITTYTKKLLISYGCTEMQTSNPKFPYFIRTQPFAREDKNQIAQILKMIAYHFKWKIMGMVFSASFGWTNIKTEIDETLSNEGLDLVMFPIQAYGSYEQLIDEMKMKVRSKTFRKQSYFDILFNFLKFQGKTRKKHYIGVLCNFTEIILWHGCSPINLLLIFRAPFYKKPLEVCIWKTKTVAGSLSKSNCLEDLISVNEQI